MANSKVNRNNYISVQGFMVRDLQLKGNELLVYAVIYGFSQAENQVFNGSLQYLADWTNSTKRSVMTCLKSLIDKGYIGKSEKFINGVKFCEYYATDFTGVVKNFPYPMEESSVRGMEESSPNNIGFNNLENNIDKRDSTRAPQSARHKRGEYGHVLLTEAQEQKLIDEYGEIVTAKAITFLDEYIEMKGYKAKNHYLAIKKWVIDAVRERMPKEQGSYQGSFDTDDFFGAAIAKTFAKTAGEDEEIRKRAEALKQKLS